MVIKVRGETTLDDWHNFSHNISLTKKGVGGGFATCYSTLSKSARFYNMIDNSDDLPVKIIVEVKGEKPSECIFRASN